VPPELPPAPVAVVGAGWAGIAAAVELTSRGLPVTLIESARAPGGRARDVTAPFATVDNGQHLLIGAYHGVLELLARLGVTEEEVLTRRRLCMHMIDLAGGEVRLDVPALPAPLHLAKALGSARGLGLIDRLSAVAFMRWLQKRRFDLPDTPLGVLLDEQRQTRRLVRALWEPLCLATLNTPIQVASARLFARVLGVTFTGSRHNCDLLWPRQSLGQLLPERGVSYVENHGGQVLTGHRVTALECAGERIDAVRLDDGQRLAVRAVILAVPAPIAQTLLAVHPALAAIAGNLAKIEHEPITTVYLRYPRPVTIDGTLRGVLGGVTQWLIDRHDCGTRDVIAAVISASGPHDELDRSTLAARVGAEAAQLFPAWPAPVEQLVLREKRATFASRAGVEALRPTARTPLQGCWFAGDWTATGLPGTLEGAVASGLESARQVAATLDQS